MTTELQEPKSASEGGKVISERELKAAKRKSYSFGLADVFSGAEAKVPAEAERLTLAGIACDSRKVATRISFFRLAWCEGRRKQVCAGCNLRVARSRSPAKALLPAEVVAERCVDPSGGKPQGAGDSARRIFSGIRRMRCN